MDFDERFSVLTKRVLADPRYATYVNKKLPMLVEPLLKRPEIIERIQRDDAFMTRLMFGFDCVPYQEAMVNDPSKEIINVWCRQSGKTLSVGAKHICKLLKNKNWTILVISFTQRQAQIIRDKMDLLLNSVPKNVLDSLFLDIQKTKLTARNGSIMWFLPNNPNAILGFTANMIWLDEFGVFTNSEYIHDQILMPMLNTTDGWMHYTLTPRTKTGKAWDIVQSPNVKLYHVNWRAALRYGILKPNRLQKLMDDRKNGLISEAMWMMEMEAQFYDDASKYISLQKIIECTEDYKLFPKELFPMAGEFYIGVDLGKLETNSVVTTWEWTSENKMKLIHVRIYALNTDYDYVIRDLKTMCQTWRGVRRVLIDRTGSVYVWEKMLREVGGVVEGWHFSDERKLEIGSYLHDKIYNKETIIPANDSLYIEDQSKASKRQQHLNFDLNVAVLDSSGKTRKIVIPEGEFSDVFWSCALGVYASKNRGGSVVEKRV